jgi:trk system potassium uptake protein TrkH
MRGLKPPHLIIGSFLCVIIAGTLLLGLPQATTGGSETALVDRIFTATSATCVTGLVVKESSSWAPFGRFVIMALFQAGGLGIMTFSTLFAILLGRRITISENLAMTGTLGQSGIKSLRGLVLYIVSAVFLIEGLGALSLFLRWRSIEAWSVSTTLYHSVFHSISAFCNAGFSLFNNSFVDLKGDVWINVIMMALIFIGGIGFLVMLNLWNLRSSKADKRPRYHRLTAQTKAAVSISLILIIAGAGMILFLEKDGVMAGMEAKERGLTALFQSVTARTAGFSTLPIKRLAAPTLITIIFLMFIGASPGSTGGGIKTCTFGVVLAALWSMIKNKDRVWFFKKTMPATIVRRSIAIFILGLGWIFLFSFLLSITERSTLYGANNYLRILFETTSAFGTVGLSTGITPLLSDIGKVLISITMFAGRIGPLTLALAVAMQEERSLFSYPEEEVMVG